MNIFLFIVLITLGMVYSIAFKKLTAVAAITGTLAASIIFTGTGWAGVALMTTFFLAGTLTTSFKKKLKQSLGVAQEKEARTAGQVLANAGVAVLLSGFAWLFPQHQKLLLVLMASAFSSATADTVSSELGTVYGKRFYDILSFKTGTRGADGIISIEGLLFGLAGSLLIAITFSISAGCNAKAILIILACGTIGNLTDSYLGATLERKGLIANNAVNFLNTTFAFLTAWLLMAIWV